MLNFFTDLAFALHAVEARLGLDRSALRNSARHSQQPQNLHFLSVLLLRSRAGSTIHQDELELVPSN